MTDLTKLAQLAEQHSSSYASPHHFVLSVAGLRSIIEALAAQPGAVGEWKRVPVEPTQEMIDATYVGQHCSDIWRDMLAAAPTEAMPAQRWPVSQDPLTQLQVAAIISAKKGGQ